jgi:hypothetical protein
MKIHHKSLFLVIVSLLAHQTKPHLEPLPTGSGFLLGGMQEP